MWSKLNDLGVFGIAVAEQHGGSGLGVVEEVYVALQLGRSLVSPAILSTLAASKLLPGKSRRTGLAYVARGETIVVDEPGVEQFLVQDGGQAMLCHIPRLDEAARDSDWSVCLHVASGPHEVIAALDEKNLLRLHLIQAAALAGIADLATDMAVAHVKIREQFGRPIGGFQAVKHHCANMAIAARRACDLVSFAAMALEDARSDRQTLVCSALLVAGAAAVENASKNIQLHGAMGFSDEALPHFALKRAQLLVATAGGRDLAIERVAAIAPPN